MSLPANLKNSKGKIFYGMHFYPGVAEYQEQGKDPYRVFLNEDTIRSMDPSFAGRPIFVEHVDGVDSNIDELRKEADGWVIESFYNSADGKHWVKFIVVSERAERAIQNQMRLSNAYVPTRFANGGTWNGVSYTKEITGGEYEHLAIVRNPRYEESVIMTPDEFKKYNEDKFVELKRLSNSKDQKGESKMAFNLFRRAKVDNAADIEGICVVLPKSKREVEISTLINEMDMAEEKKQTNDGLADPAHKVKLHDGSYCNVAELVEKHKAICDELEGMKAKKEDDMGGEGKDDASMDNGEEEKKKAAEIAEGEDKELKEAKKQNELEVAKKKEEDKAKALALKNAHLKTVEEKALVVDLPELRVARGKAQFGSN